MNPLVTSDDAPDMTDAERASGAWISRVEACAISGLSQEALKSRRRRRRISARVVARNAAGQVAAYAYSRAEMAQIAATEPYLRTQRAARHPRVDTPDPASRPSLTPPDPAPAPVGITSARGPTSPGAQPETVGASMPVDVVDRLHLALAEAELAREKLARRDDRIAALEATNRQLADQVATLGELLARSARATES